MSGTKTLSAEKQEDIIIESVGDFLNALGKIESLESTYFRGHSDCNDELKPSIYRDSNWIENEDVLFKEMVLKCPNDFHQQESTFQMLVKMQHYTLPTRLLDLTENPLIALYFACLERDDKNGEVVILRIPISEVRYHDSDTVSVISNISRRPKTFNIPKENDLKKFNDSEDIKYLLHEIKREKPYFESKIKKEHLESVVCVKPKLDNPRIIRQYGAFLLFGVSGSKCQSATVKSEYIYTKQRIFVKHSNKKIILDQLKILGITKASVYPEIDTVASYLKETYAKKS